MTDYRQKVHPATRNYGQGYRQIGQTEVRLACDAVASECRMTPIEFSQLRSWAERMVGVSR